MEPEPHVLGARRFRPDLVARIFDLDIDALQMEERSAQCAHVRQMKRHVPERLRRGLRPMQRDRDIVIADRNAAVELKLLL